MIVEMEQEVTSQDEAEDTLAGWRAINGFAVGYLRTPRTEAQKLTVVGLFHAEPGQIKRGQREIVNLEVNLSTILRKEGQ